MFLNKYSTHLTCEYLKIKMCYNVETSADYFYVKTKIAWDFQICISVLLKK